MTKKVLWDKGEEIDDGMRRLTAGTDPIFDLRLVEFDALGSAAHARMLSECGLLPSSELPQLLACLNAIYEQGRAGLFEIPVTLEDVHTAVELKLTEQCGEAGERINTARSRSDQAALDVRLYLRSKVVSSLCALLSLSDEIVLQYRKVGSVAMPGYTHYQPAMPSSVGMWLHAWFEWAIDLIDSGLFELQLLEQNPLGAGAGFGTSLPINPRRTAELLGFPRIQSSAIDVNNRRGWFEERVVRWWGDVAFLFEKWASDVILFTSREYQFLSLPSELTTGSSIMPQKRNYDLVELLRAGASRVRGASFEIQAVISKLPSSYHRDLQYTKEPLFRASDDIERILAMAVLMISKLQVNEERLSNSLYPDIYATYCANRYVQHGVPFRSAYRQTAQQLKDGSFSSLGFDIDFDRMRVVTAEAMQQAQLRVEGSRTQIKLIEDRINQVPERVFGVP